MSSNQEVQDSAELVQRILNNDMRAEAQMISLYQEGLYTVLRGKINAADQDMLDDVIQETWRIVIEKVRADQLNDHQKLAAFIIKIGCNQLIMHYRKKNSQNFVSDEAIELLEDDSVEPNKLLEQSKTKVLVGRLIEKLKKPRDREILRSYYLKEQSKDVICNNQALDELHFNRVLHRARNRFKKLWQSESDDE